MLDFSSRNALLGSLKPLLQELGAPANLPMLFHAIVWYQSILVEMIQIADDASLPKLQKIGVLIAELKNNLPKVVLLLPEAAVADGAYRGYMKSNPLYCIHERRILDKEIWPHRLAMLASIYPALRRLHDERKLDSARLMSTDYQVGHALRNLAQPNAPEKEFLLALPLSVTPWIEYLGELDAVAERLMVKLAINSEYVNFYWVRRLLVGMDGVSWLPDDSGRKGRPSGSRSPNRRYAKESEVVTKWNEIEREFGPEISNLQTVNYFRRPSRQDVVSELFDPDLKYDTRPQEATVRLNLGKVLQYHYRQHRAQVAQNARYAAQAIELANQRLPITIGTLSQYEVAHFLDVLLDLNRPEWSEIQAADRLLTAIWAGMRFFFSRDEEALKGMLVSNGKSIVSFPQWDRRAGTITLSTLPPKHKAPPAESNFVNTCNSISLTIPAVLVSLLDQLSKPRGRLFANRSNELEKQLGALLNAINRQWKTGLTPARLQRVMADRMSLMAPSDDVVGCYFQGRLPNSHIPSVYSAVPVNRLKQLFYQAGPSVDRPEVSASAKHDLVELPGLVQMESEFVGSRHVPLPDFVKNVIADVTTKVTRLVDAPASAVVDAHNYYTAYVALFLLVTSGIRSSSEILPSILDLDWKSGFCLTSEKDNDRYTEARPVCLVPLVLEQLRIYLEHVGCLRKYLALISPKSLDRLDKCIAANKLSSHKSPNRDQDLKAIHEGTPVLFLLSGRGLQIVPVQEWRIKEVLGAEWELRLGSIRHFVRSHLLWFGCSGESIDALLGHWTRGAEPWGRFSTLPPVIWRQQIEVAMRSLTEQMGLKVMASPLKR